MSRIDSIFRDLRRDGRKALMPFLTAGFPSLEATADAIPRMEAAGASAVEIGFPFSDPIADGPVIASAMHQAPLGGVTPRHVFEVVRSVRDQTEIGLIGMVSQSIVQRMSPAAFMDEASASGLDGLIIPDADTDDARGLSETAASRGMSFTLLVSPTTPAARIAEVTGICRGFVYVLARVGVTGVRAASPEIRGLVEAVRATTDLPIAVGFGVSKPEHVRSVTSLADGAIVGSALVERMSSADDPAGAAESFVRELARGLPTGVDRARPVG